MIGSETQRDILVIPHTDHLRFTRTDPPFPRVSHQWLRSHSFPPSEFRTNGEKEGQEEPSPRSLSFIVNPLGVLSMWCGIFCTCSHTIYTRQPAVHTPRCWAGQFGERQRTMITHWFPQGHRRETVLYWQPTCIACHPLDT